MAGEGIQLHHRVVRAPGHRFDEVDQGVVLLSLEAGEFYRLNEVGSAIWLALDLEIPVSTLCEDVAKTFGTDATAVEQDVLSFLNQLLKHRLISVA